jgi:hypothetical protein
MCSASNSGQELLCQNAIGPRQNARREWLPNVWVVAEEHALPDGVGIRPEGLPCKGGSSEIFFDDMLERDY